MTSTTTLRGMTWNHERGLRPLVEASKLFLEKTGVEITWDARSLSDFELFPLEELAETYDLIMIDHPHIGVAHGKNLLTPLETLLSPEFLAEQKTGEVGQSYDSYTYQGHQYALPVDAATQVSAFRPDLLKKPLPKTWEEVFALNTGKNIAIPFVPVHAYSSFFTLCSHFQTEKFWSNEADLSLEVGEKALDLLIGLLAIAHPDSKDLDPILLLDAMMTKDEIHYAPLIYGYSNYARQGFGANLIEFADMPKENLEKAPYGSMIGGVGLAISSACKDLGSAVKFVEMVATPQFQKQEFFDGGGQPGHIQAWTDPRVNEINHNFYKNTLETMRLGSLRPRFEGYIDFQGKAGALIRDFVLEGTGNKRAFIEELNTLLDTCRKNKGLEKG